LKRWWWVLLAVLVCIGQWRLRFDSDVLNLLPSDEPAVQGLKIYQEQFANARELIITLRAPDAEKAERLAGAVAERLRQETNLIADVIWQPPWTENPGQLVELLGYMWLNQPPELFGALTNRRAGRDEGIARHIAVADGHRPAGIRSVRHIEHAGADEYQRHVH
jgi:hypothetical protein